MRCPMKLLFYVFPIVTLAFQFLRGLVQPEEPLILYRGVLRPHAEEERSRDYVAIKKTCPDIKVLFMSGYSCTRKVFSKTAAI